MLTQEENELLCRIGPGTPMGEVFRRYWLVAGISREVPEPDCPPVRVRLLGEDLVMFRDSNGRVGLLAESCAHRRASLFYGRNEDGGLRCIYHGWKYDVTGNILDTPTEPAASLIKHTVKQTAYPCVEANGLVMTYMGPPEKQPLLPNYEWLTLPPDHVSVEGKYWNESNWLQGVEGDCDSAHIEYLHRAVGGRGTGAPLGDTLDLPPGYGVSLDWDIDRGDWWVKIASIRHLRPGHDYVRVNAFVLPCIGLPPTAPPLDGIADGFQVVYQVPADDTHTWRIDIRTRRSRPIPGPVGGEWDPTPWKGLDGLPAVGPDWKKTANRSNDYLIDRAIQRTRVYSGVPFGFHTQDACVTESMGPISDRWHEHLGVCDTGAVAMRQLLARAIRDVQEGKDPPGVAFRPEDNAFGDIFLTVATLPPETLWNDRDLVRTQALYSGPPPRA